MRKALTLHPDFRCAAVDRIDVDAARAAGGRLTLRYVVSGRIGDLALPPVAAPARTDELWRHTCLEAFVRVPPDAGYREFNFAPSSQWAAYRFDGCRAGMRNADDGTQPVITMRRTVASLEMDVVLDLSSLAQDPPWQLGLSAVIEEASGAKSYWALAHPKGRADFHHSDCFALQLAPA